VVEELVEGEVNACPVAAQLQVYRWRRRHHSFALLNADWMQPGLFIENLGLAFEIVCIKL